jgi:uncharacterized protein DUF4198
MKAPPRRILLGLPVVAASCFTSFAHDLWIEPHADASGGAVLLRAVVGARFPTGEETKRIDDYRNAFLQQGGKKVPLPGFGMEPTLLGSLSGKEPFFVAVTGPAREIDLKPEEVREYLTEEVGADAALIDALLSDAGAKLHETYSRTLKAFVIPRGASSASVALSPAGEQGVGDDPFGLPLEIILTGWNPGHDPARNTALRSPSLEFQLRKEGKPLAGAFVRIVQGDGKTQRVRTDKDGKAGTRELSERGPVLLAFIELSTSRKGRYETRWTNLAIHDLR